MSPICNQMLVPYDQLCCMLIVEVGSNNYEASTLRTVSREYNIIILITSIYSKTCTNWYVNRKRWPKYLTKFPIANLSVWYLRRNYNSYEVSTIGTVSSEYQRILQNTPIFSDHHKMRWQKATRIQLCNIMLVHCTTNLLVHVVIAEDDYNSF
jgi:hypothetical protein